MGRPVMNFYILKPLPLKDLRIVVAQSLKNLTYKRSSLGQNFFKAVQFLPIIHIFLSSYGLRFLIQKR